MNMPMGMPTMPPLHGMGTEQYYPPHYPYPAAYGYGGRGYLPQVRAPPQKRPSDSACEFPRRVRNHRQTPNRPSANRFANVQLESLRGEIYGLCKDQHGCRYLQKKLEERNPEHIEIIFAETNQHVVELMTGKRIQMTRVQAGQAWNMTCESS
jgi:hypothetical protein